MANHFSTHHAAAGKAFSAGDHSKAMHHIGHMMMAVRNASRSARSAAPTGAPAGPGADDDLGEPMNASGIATPAPMPAKQHFFGQTARRAAPKKAPHVAGHAGLGATNHTPTGGFNRARFGALKGR